MTSGNQSLYLLSIHVPFWRASGCLLQQTSGNRCRHCGPQRTQVSPQRVYGKPLRWPQRGPRPQPGYILHRQVLFYLSSRQIRKARVMLSGGRIQTKSPCWSFGYHMVKTPDGSTEGLRHWTCKNKYLNNTNAFALSCCWTAQMQNSRTVAHLQDCQGLDLTQHSAAGQCPLLEVSDTLPSCRTTTIIKW